MLPPDDTKWKQSRELGERVKELNCFYGISGLVENPALSLEGILQGTVDLIPPAWQYPEIACARITLEDQEFRTENFRETAWKQASDVIVHGKRVGALEVCYLEERPEIDEGLFLNEEKKLLNVIAKRLGRIIERKRAEEALRESEKRYRDLFEGIPACCWTFDREGTILDWNQACEELYGWTAEQAIGKTMYDLMVKGENVPPTQEKIAAVFQGRSFQGIEYEDWRADGTTCNVLVNEYPLKDASGQVILGICAELDITEHKRIEEQLRQQERLAAVGQLAGGIAHDFNNLLTTIMLYAQMPLGRRDLPPDLARAFETIISESREAAKLVQQILDFSRRSPIETHPMDLKPFVKEAVRILERTIPESISFLLELGPGEYMVDADPTRVQQVLMNLVLNARDAMSEGGELRIDLSRVKVRPGEAVPVAGMPPLSSPPVAGGIGRGEWVCLAVSDTGTGIPPEVLPHIFEPFFTTKGPGEGAGLGLAQVYGIVAQHNGHIGVETETGQGTTFRVYLPTYGVDTPEEVEAEETPSPPQGRGETILLVEDNEKLQEVGQSILESLGYRVLTAANGQEALAVYEAEAGARPEQRPEFAEGARSEHSRRIDLLITDVVMPEMGGKELMRELRDMNPDLKALAITGYVMQDDMKALRKDGFLDIVHKPFDMATLAQVVRRALDVALDVD